MTDHDPRDRELQELANPSKPSRSGEILEPGQVPRGAALVRPTTGLADRIIGSQPVAQKRNEIVVRDKLRELAAWAGSDWFYRFPVRKQDGSQDWIDGPSIKLANNVARVFGNCVVEIREVDLGDAWTFYARFTDIETGFSMERAYRQRKGQVTLKTKDPQRALDQVYGIGQSKAIRNVVVNALGLYCDFAFDEARNSIVDKIGKNIEGSRTRAIERIKQLSVELPRVERVIGRASKAWLAPDIARIVAMIQSVEDGMSSAEDTFPKIESSVTAPSQQAHGVVPERGGEQMATAPDDESHATGSPPEQASFSSDADEAPAAADDPLRAAYEAGVQAKAAGQRRSALPGEFRNAAHDEQAQAWLRGHDGKPF